MTDREMLELAAKAAGFTYNPTVVHEDGSLHGCYLTDDAQEAWPWNPLTADGDALRLAVKLGMIVSICAHPDLLEVEASVFPDGRPSSLTVRENYTTDPYAATRRAIVRAAAEIGRSMP